ncbi:MAG: DoxX family protein [Terriglobales bacterium]
MNFARTKNDRLAVALRILQWVLGLVILEESVRFAFSPAAARAFAHTGMPDFIRRGLAWAEIAAAVLFLVPRATVAGGWFLIVVLASAIVLHLLHGWFDVGVLVVYAAGTWAVIAGRSAQAEQQT